MKTQDLTEQQVIDAAKSKENPFEYLCETYPRKIVEARIRKMASKGIIDWGVAIDRFWLVDRSRIDISSQ